MNIYEQIQERQRTADQLYRNALNERLPQATRDLNAVRLIEVRLEIASLTKRCILEDALSYQQAKEAAEVA